MPPAMLEAPRGRDATQTAWEREINYRTTARQPNGGDGLFFCALSDLTYGSPNSKCARQVMDHTTGRRTHE